MGEFADYTLDETIDAEEERADFRSGNMSHEDAYEKGIIDELGAEIRPKSVEELELEYKLKHVDPNKVFNALMDPEVDDVIDNYRNEDDDELG